MPLHGRHLLAGGLLGGVRSLSTACAMHAEVTIRRAGITLQRSI
ncbi:MAG: hypothetical protein WC617_01230 [Rhodanobacter sp.]|jgi:hypothetical protein